MHEGNDESEGHGEKMALPGSQGLGPEKGLDMKLMRRTRAQKRHEELSGLSL